MVYEAIGVGSCGGKELGEARGGCGCDKLEEVLAGLRRGQMMVGGADEVRDHASCRS